MPVQSLARIGLSDAGPLFLLGLRRIRDLAVSLWIVLAGLATVAGGRGLATRRRLFEHELRLRRWLFLLLVVATTATGVAWFWTVLRIDGTTPLEIALISVFGIVFAWIATSFWLTAFGIFAHWRAVPLHFLRHAPRRTGRVEFHGAARTVIAMPIYNEDVDRVFARLEAIATSLRTAGGAGDFEFFVLSDSTDPAIRQAEQAAARRLRHALAGSFPLHYRRRSENKGRKSGNIAEFCENWGRRYEHMVVLDADSLMTGETLLRLVDLMDANPKVGLIQVPPQIIGRDSLFARVQQFASSVYGPIFATGLAYLQGSDGNYWGHNAIIRVKAFMDQCGLPLLSGKAPLGGEIMSHDFVEAALLRRAGWEVWMAPDLGGSFEETPTTSIDYLARERRWCQGNMQHLKIIAARGLTLPSRMHFAIGIMSYLSSPLWLLLLGLSAVEAYQIAQIPEVSYVGGRPVLTWPISHAAAVTGLLSAMIVLLLGPKLFAFALMLRNRRLTAAHGGAVALARSIFWETVFSALFAPVAMLAHSWFVINILFGRSAGWASQERDDHLLPFRFVARVFAPHTIIGLVAALAVALFIPGSFWWLSPILVGLILAIPVSWLSSSPDAGRWARSQGLFLNPTETTEMAIVPQMASDRARTPAAPPAPTANRQAA
ncbi:glucans biosynthesis glucosyltransferase MdoH [Oceanibacterium hippocampi]|nr:glucans biosynthesis glucosyltransferase MdoH [Oceanibacterium hippocampi]